jgi:hypothetical protein
MNKAERPSDYIEVPKPPKRKLTTIRDHVKETARRFYDQPYTVADIVRVLEKNTGLSSRHYNISGTVRSDFSRNHGKWGATKISDPGKGKGRSGRGNRAVYMNKEYVTCKNSQDGSTS